MIFSPDSVKLTFIQTGSAVWRKSVDGFVHEKTIPCIIIAQAVEGSYEVGINGEASVKLKSGEAFLTAPNVPLAITHHVDSESRTMRARWVHFNLSVFNVLELASLVKFPLRMERCWANRIGVLSEEIISEELMVKQNPNSMKTFNSRLKINSITLQIISILMDFLESKGIYPEFKNNMRRLFPALEYAKRNFSNQIEVKKLARITGLSVPRFHVEFKKHFETTPIEYIRRLRLSKACDLLRSSNCTLEEIAMGTGFCNQFHFSREFKKFYNESPSSYRKTIDDSFPLK